MNVNNISRKTACLAIKYCEKIFKKDNSPAIRLARTRLKDDPPCKGYYDEDKNLILVVKPNHRSFLDFIDTIIHEYTHSTQCMEQYTKMFTKYGYDRHPYEREANKMAKRHAKKCKRYIAHHMNM